MVCNDIQESRINKIHNVMAEYIGDYQSWGSRLIFTQMNAKTINEPDTYNKVIIINYVLNYCNIKYSVVIVIDISRCSMY